MVIAVKLGAFLRFSNGDIRWFSEQWTSSDFLALDIPLHSDMHKNISSYETFAQFCLLYSLCHLLPDQRFSITLKSLSDNTAAEANSFFIYHQIPVVRFCGTIVYVDFCSSCRT
jgi:hypothetical protein